MFHSLSHSLSFFFFFFTDPPTTEIYTLSLHDALPICGLAYAGHSGPGATCASYAGDVAHAGHAGSPAGSERRSEEHTSELQSLTNLVCRLLLEKKKRTYHRENRCTAT